ncbi:MAG: sulfatase-like hydrolase/transferase [Actinomycetia bacterium]|nr:sulfatase-like hydrolase/transferase [Actinomycetes bacterium]MCP4959831.1 sulfatase-like hydrolase/transferase [Actinomycetes bacterium]
MSTTQPNVLFVITDQQRADHVGFAGNGVVRTPNIDAIAERGTVFENAWVANPVCMPNRSSIMTGRMPTAHGVVFNDRSLDWGANTFVRRFRSSGYRTGLIGKSHLQHGMSRNSMVSVDTEAAVSNPYPDGWDRYEDFESYHNGPPEFPDSFYGFDHVELAIDHGARVTGHHLHWALNRGGRIEDLLTPLTDESPGSDRHPSWWQIYRPPYDPEFHSTTFVTDRTISFIEDATARKSPWLAWASFPDPHHPICPPGDWFDRHSPDDIELPASIDDPLEDAIDYIKVVSQVHPSKQRMWVHPCGVGGDHDMVRASIAATYGMVEMIDEGVGQIMAAIDRLGQLDNTIVVFTSDHGDMMGDHGLMLKGLMHYRGTLQVPMVIADPRQSPGRTSSLASSIDLGPTLLDLAGVTGYDGIQGTTLRPSIEDPGAASRDHVLIEDDLPRANAIGRLAPAKSRTIINADGIKYSRHSTGEDQLFDLSADHDEMNHLGTADPALRARMVDELATALLESADDARGTPIG